MKAVIAGVALALSACSTTGSLDAAIKKNLPQTCNLINTAHAAFVAASASGSIKAKTIAKEEAAYQGIAVICANPEDVNASNALVLAATAYAQISLALREAKSAQE